RPEEHACKLWNEKLIPCSASSMHDKHCVANHTLRIAHGSSYSSVMQLQLRQSLAASEMKITNQIIPLSGRRIGRLLPLNCGSAVLSRRYETQHAQQQRRQ